MSELDINTILIATSKFCTHFIHQVLIVCEVWQCLEIHAVEYMCTMCYMCVSGLVLLSFQLYTALVLAAALGNEC